MILKPFGSWQDSRVIEFINNFDDNDRNFNYINYFDENIKI